MEPLEFTSAADGLTIHAYRWRHDEPVATVQIAHGLAEHARRYDRLAQALVAAGYEVFANDHRGHGASVDEATPLGAFGTGGWDALVDDVVQLAGLVADARPKLAHFLIGHSMGSFASQLAVLDHSEAWDGVVLSGSTAIDVLAAALPTPEGGAGTEAGAEEGVEEAAGDLSAFNAGFEHRTGFEWLSRDEAEVDAYVADPLCGFPTAPDVLPSLLGSGARTGDTALLECIRPDLPLLIVSGRDDPLAGQGQLLEVLAGRYREAGLNDVELEVYPGARHEVFNETNRDEVTARVIAWLDAHR